MALFGRAPKKDQDLSPGVQFLVDQDGPMERTLKAKLVEFFSDVVQVEQAYFARVQFAGKVQSVALCVYGTPEMDAQLVLRGVSSVYSRLVPTDQGLQTIFLTPAQKVDIGKTCRPFFNRSKY